MGYELEYSDEGEQSRDILDEEKTDDNLKCKCSVNAVSHLIFRVAAP